VIPHFAQVLAWRSDFKFYIFSRWLRPIVAICREVWCDNFDSTEAPQSFRHNEVIVGHTIRFQCENLRSYSLDGMAAVLIVFQTSVAHSMCFKQEQFVGFALMSDTQQRHVSWLFYFRFRSSNCQMSVDFLRPPMIIYHKHALPFATI